MLMSKENLQLKLSLFVEEQHRKNPDTCSFIMPKLIHDVPCIQDGSIASCFYPSWSNVDELKKSALSLGESIRSTMNYLNEFHYRLIGTGTSGVLMGTQISWLFKQHYLHIRKPNEVSHSNTFWPKGEPLVIVDDDITSGDTVIRLLKEAKVNSAIRDIKCIAVANHCPSGVRRICKFLKDDKINSSIYILTGIG